MGKVKRAQAPGSNGADRPRRNYGTGGGDFVAGLRLDGKAGRNRIKVGGKLTDVDDQLTLELDPHQLEVLAGKFTEQGFVASGPFLGNSSLGEGEKPTVRAFVYGDEPLEATGRPLEMREILSSAWGVRSAFEGLEQDAYSVPHGPDSVIRFEHTGFRQMKIGRGTSMVPDFKFKEWAPRRAAFKDLAAKNGVELPDVAGDFNDDLPREVAEDSID